MIIEYSESDMSKKEFQQKHSLSNNSTEAITKHIKKKKKKLHSNKYDYRYCPEHPRSGSDGYVLDHIYVAEITANRTVTETEVVHHINMNHKDNSPDNLHIMDNKKHSQCHGHSLNKALIPLINTSIITFNKNTSRYQVNELLPVWYNAEGKYNFEAWQKGKTRPKRSKIKKEDKQVLLFP
jgi:hypothetical protein